MNFQAFVTKQMRWSASTLGRGGRLKGILDHIRKELVEIEENPKDATEYADVIILACDLAWRQGITPYELCKALEAKQFINSQRTWNVKGDDEPCHHVKDECACDRHEWVYLAHWDVYSCRVCLKKVPAVEFRARGL